MTIKSGINGTSLNNFSLGDGRSSDKIIYENKNISNNPYLKYNHIDLSWQFSNDGTDFNNIASTIFGGDCSGDSSNITVVGLRGISIVNNVPQDGYILIYNQIQNKWIMNSFGNVSIALLGDLSGDFNTAKVIGFNGVNLTNDSPSDGYGYIYNSILSKFEPVKVNSNSSIITVGIKGSLTADNTKYLLPDFTEASDESFIAFLSPTNGTLSNLTLYCDTAPGGEEYVVITIVKNGINTSISSTISGTNKTASDIINLENLSSGDKITFKSQTSSNCVAANLFVSLIFTTPINDKPINLISKSGSKIGCGIFANIPTVHTSGDLYFATDSWTSQWISANNSWNPLFNGRVIGTRPPLVSAFTAINTPFGLTDDNGSLRFTAGNDGSNIYFRGYGLSNTSSTAYIETCFFNSSTAVYNSGMINPVELGAAYYLLYVGMRESSTDKSIHFAQVWNSTTYYFEINSYSNSNTRSSVATIPYPSRGMEYSIMSGRIFMRVRRDATTIYFETSENRIYWCLIASYSIASYFTTAPNQVTVGTFCYNMPLYLVNKAVITHLKTGSL